MYLVGPIFLVQENSIERVSENCQEESQIRRERSRLWIEPKSFSPPIMSKIR